MQIPHTLLSPETLRSVVQEFVTRDGTDNSSVEQRIVNVLRQLDSGLVELHYDAETESCSIQPVGRNPPSGDENA